MKESIKKYMKVGLIHFMAFPECMKGEGPVLETMKKIAVDDYFDAIEVTWIKNRRRKCLDMRGLLLRMAVSRGF